MEKRTILTTLARTLPCTCMRTSGEIKIILLRLTTLLLAFLPGDQNYSPSWIGDESETISNNSSAEETEEPPEKTTCKG